MQRYGSIEEVRAAFYPRSAALLVLPRDAVIIGSAAAGTAAGMARTGGIGQIVHMNGHVYRCTAIHQDEPEPGTWTYTLEPVADADGTLDRVDH